jgi:hypothetical protein
MPKKMEAVLSEDNIPQEAIARARLQRDFHSTKGSKANCENSKEQTEHQN